MGQTHGTSLHFRDILDAFPLIAREKRLIFAGHLWDTGETDT